MLYPVGFPFKQYTREELMEKLASAHVVVAEYESGQRGKYLTPDGRAELTRLWRHFVKRWEGALTVDTRARLLQISDEVRTVLLTGPGLYCTGYLAHVGQDTYRIVGRDREGSERHSFTLSQVACVEFKGAEFAKIEVG